MNYLDPAQNKKLAAYLAKADVYTGAAIKEALKLVSRELEATKANIEAHYKRTEDALYQLDRRMAEHEAAVQKMMDVDPTTLSRAQLTRLARKLNL